MGERSRVRHGRGESGTIRRGRRPLSGLRKCQCVAPSTMRVPRPRWQRRALAHSRLSGPSSASSPAWPTPPPPHSQSRKGPRHQRPPLLGSYRHESSTRFVSSRLRQTTLKWSMAVGALVVVLQAISHPPRQRRPCWSVKRARPSAEGQTRHGQSWFICDAYMRARAKSPDARETAPRGDAYLGRLS